MFSEERAELVSERVQEMIEARFLEWDMMGDESLDQYLERKKQRMDQARRNLQKALTIKEVYLK